MRKAWSIALALIVVLIATLAGNYQPTASAAATWYTQPAQETQLALTPPMGWNSWNAFHKQINENLIKAEAQQLVSSGLAAAGYNTLVVDGGWRAPTRDANGNIQGDPTAFPSGMKALADYVHSLGLKFGLHLPVGVTDCGGTSSGTQSAPGGEQQDADTLASWGVDFIKYDLCRYQFPSTTTPGAPDFAAITVQDSSHVLGKYEAASPANTLSGGARVAACALCPGERDVTAIGLLNGTISFQHVTTPADGTYTLTIQYVNVEQSNAPLHSAYGKQRMALLSVNGGQPTSTYYPVPTDANGNVTGWGTTDTLSVQVQLHRGSNTLTFSDPNSSEDAIRSAYQRMANAIAKTGRTITLSISEYGDSRPWLWAPGVAQMWRTTNDLTDNWNTPGTQSVTLSLSQQVGLSQYAGPGHWNDSDMLQVGNGGMTAVEDQSSFSLWAMLASPLMMGNDLTQMSPTTLSILSNSEVIAVDQDRLGVEGHKISDDGEHQIWIKPLADGSVAVLLLNEGTTSATLGVSTGELGLQHAPSYQVRDLWVHTTSQATSSIQATVASHGVAMFRVWPQR